NLLRDAQRGLSHDVIRSNVANDRGIDCVSRDNNSVITDLYRIRTFGEVSRYYDEWVVGADEIAEFLHRVDLVSQFGRSASQLAFTIGRSRCLLRLDMPQAIFGKRQVRIGVG